MKLLKLLTEVAVALVVVIAISNFTEEITRYFLLDRYQAGNQIILRLLDNPDIDSISGREVVVTDDHLRLEGFAPANQEILFIVNGVRDRYPAYSSEKARFEHTVYLRSGINNIVARPFRPTDDQDRYYPETNWRIQYRPVTPVLPKVIASRTTKNPTLDSVPDTYVHKIWGIGEPNTYIETCSTVNAETRRRDIETDRYGFFAFSEQSNTLHTTVTLSPSSRVPAYRNFNKQSPYISNGTFSNRPDSQSKAPSQEPCSQPSERVVVYDSQEEANDFTRRLEIIDKEDEAVQLKATITLPDSVPFAWWTGQHKISAEDLFFYLFDVDGSIDFSRAGNPNNNRDDISVVTLTDERTIRVSFSLRAHIGNLTFYREDSHVPDFLSHAKDELKLMSADIASIETNISPLVENNQLIWKGGRKDGHDIWIGLNAQQATVKENSDQQEEQRELIRATTQKSPVEAINQLASKIPILVRDLGSWGLLAIPFFWFLYVLKISTAVIPQSFQARAYAFTVIALVIHFGYVLIWFTRVDLYPLVAPLAPQEWDLRGIQLITRSAPELVFGIALCAASLAMALESTPPALSVWRRRLWLMLRCIIFLPLAGTVLYGVVKLDTYIYGQAPLPEWGIAAIAVLVAALFSCVFIYWLFRAVLQRPIPLKVSVAAAIGLILLPTIPRTVAALTSWLQLQALNFGISPFVIPSGTANFVWCVLLTLLGAYMLWLLLRLVLSLCALPVPENGKRRAIIALFLLMSLPFSYLANEQLNAWTVVSFFSDLSYSLRYIILIPIYLFLRHIATEDNFESTQTEILMVTMLFAFYLCGQSTNLLLVPIPLLLGWYLFKDHLLMSSESFAARLSSTQSRANTVALLLDVKETQRLQQGYKKQGEKAYTSGDLERDAYEAGMELAAERVKDAKTALGMSERDARESLFALGPGPGRWSNARNAVLYSIPIIVLYQLSLIDRAFRDQTERSYPLFDIVTPLLSGTFIWLICAFLFGYLFHLIKGRNGIQKALALSSAIILPTLVVLILNNEPILGENAGERILRIALFLLYLGLVAFDFKVLRDHQRGVKDLVAVYGLGQVIAFASSFVAIGSVALGPMLTQLLSLLMTLLGFGGNGE